MVYCTTAPCVHSSDSDSVFRRGMNILWSELIRCSASWELRGEFVLFQIICVDELYISRFQQCKKNEKTTQLQLETEASLKKEGAVQLYLHPTLQKKKKKVLAHFTVHLTSISTTHL